MFMQELKYLFLRYDYLMKYYRQRLRIITLDSFILIFSKFEYKTSKIHYRNIPQYLVRSEVN